MRPRLTPVLLIAALAVAASCSEGGQQSSRDADKVTICHATSSSGNPFTQNSVDKDGTVSGHDGHPNDIIPPFDYLDNNGASQQYPGKNWTGEGQAIHDNGCTPVTSTSEPTTTTATEATEGPVTNEPEGTGGGGDDHRAAGQRRRGPPASRLGQATSEPGRQRR